MNARRWRVLALLAMALALGCGRDVTSPTMLVVEVDSDLAVGSDLDAVVLTVVRPNQRSSQTTYPLSSEAQLPLLVGVLPADGPGGANEEVLITATGNLRGSRVTEEHATVAFSPNRKQLLRLYLARACRGDPCGADLERTCTRGGQCIPRRRSSLPDFEATRDGGISQADGPAPDRPAPDGPTPDGPTPDAPITDAPTPDGRALDGPAPDRLSVDVACGAVGQPCCNGNACAPDQDMCNGAEVCQQGMCVRTAPVTCRPSDACHDAGTCDPTTGRCSDPVKPNNTPCGSSGCSMSTCQDGVCTSSGTNTCNDNNPCTQDSCVAGTCTFVPINADMPCTNDNNSCTLDVCDNNGKCLHKPTREGGSCTPAKGGAGNCQSGYCCPGTLPPPLGPACI